MDDIDLKSKFKVSGQLLQSLFEDGRSPLSENFLRWKLWSRWKVLVGNEIAAHSEPVGYNRKKLYIFVKNSSVLHHLYYLKGNILKRIKSDFHPTFVNDIIFTTDRKNIPSNSADSDGLKKQIEQLLGKDTDVESDY